MFKDNVVKYIIKTQLLKWVISIILKYGLVMS